MPEPALIGPNAVLQYLPVIQAAHGTRGLDSVLVRSGLSQIPDGTRMIAQDEAARLHWAVRKSFPDAADMAWKAGDRTGAYILQHRIPRLASTVLRALPARIAAPLLARAIDKHAWTFAGSGTFTAHGPWHFEIANNPIVAGEAGDTPLCHWHCAVFQHLYRALVAPDATCTETRCCAQSGRGPCTFHITRD